MGIDRNVLVGTFYHPASVHATMVEVSEDVKRNKEPGHPSWTIIKLPGIIDEGTPKARALYPTRLSLEELERKRLSEIDACGNDLNWRMQIMLDFKASADYAFDMTFWQEIDLDAPDTEGDLKVSNAIHGAPTFAFGDFAGKDDSTKGRGDRNAIEIWTYPLIDGQVHRVLLDAHYDDMSTLDEACEIELKMASMYDAWYVVAEETVAHRVVGQRLSDIATRLGLRYFQRIDRGKQTGTIITLIPKRSGVEGIGAISSWKMARMNKFQGAFNQGRVWINSQIDESFRLSFQEELESFPFIKFDDIVDAASQADDQSIASLIPIPRVKKKPIPIHRQIGTYQNLSRYTGLKVRRR
jgi:hypothetical protein